MFEGIVENIWFTDTYPTKEITMNIKLARVHDSFTVNIYENGYMVEFSGQDQNDEFVTQKIIAHDVDELVTLISNIVKMDRAD